MLFLFLIMSDIVIKHGKCTLTLLDSLLVQEGNFESSDKLHRTQLWRRIKTTSTCLQFLFNTNDLVFGLDYFLNHSEVGRVLLKKYEDARFGLLSYSSLIYICIR